MSTRYKFVDNTAVYFTTSTVAGWTDVFTREMYKTILLDSIRHCQINQGINIHAWVLMTNHQFPWLVSSRPIILSEAGVNCLQRNELSYQKNAGQILLPLLVCRAGKQQSVPTTNTK